MIRCKVICLIVSFIVASNARNIVPNSNLLMVEDNYGNLRKVDLEDTRLELAAKATDVTYYFFTKDTQKNPVVIENNGLEQLQKFSYYFKAGRKTIFITHGWNNDYSSPVNTLITEAILSVYDVNIFVVNWGRIANKNYFTARYAIDVIGKTEADFINKLASTYELPYSDFILIGHSLGAHVAGIAGANTFDKVDHIVGLDPAAPLFISSNPDTYLEQTDANYVQVIHTSHLGMQSLIGHSDFFPNGGTSQPGCFLDLTSACAHGRSYMYFADSISQERFVGLKCDTYRHFERDKCSDAEKSVMGKLFPDKRAIGTYYLDTNSAEPFARKI